MEKPKKKPKKKIEVVELNKEGSGPKAKSRTKAKTPKTENPKTGKTAPDPEPKTSQGAKEESPGGGFGFGLGKMKELSEAFKKAQEIQKGAGELQKELEAMRLEGTSKDGSVTCVINGNQAPIRISIKTVEGKTAEEVSQSAIEAMKAGYKMSTDTMKKRMEKLTGSLNLPTLEDLSE